MTTQVLKWRPRGPILFGTRDTTVTPNKPKVFSPASCADQISLALTSQFATHNSKCNALDLEDFRLIKSLAAEAAIDLTDYTPANVLLGLSATKTAAEGAPAVVTNEALPLGLVDGDIVAVGGATPHYNLTAVSLTDGASSPATLVLNTDYTVDAANGMLTILNVGAYSQPFMANYSHQDPQILAALAAGQVERWVRFNGFNSANSSSLVVVDMFRMLVAPTKAFDLLPDDHGTMQLAGAILFDPSRASNDPRGQFFSVAMAA